MSLNNTFSRHALKQFVSLLDGVTVTTDIEEILWAKIQAQPVATSSIKIPVTVLRKALKKSKIELPYMPSVINYNIGCTALKVTGGLYIPCCAKCVEDSQFCAACEKHEAKYGVLSDRGETGTYMDPSDKHETSYGTWLSMNSFTIEDVSEALNEEGFKISIPSEYLTVNSKRINKEKKSRKGRPKSTKKEVVEDESESEEAVEPPPPDFGSDEEEAPKPIKKKEAAVKLPVLKIAVHSDDDDDDDVPIAPRLPAIGAKHAPAAILTAPSKSDTEEEEPKKAKKPKAKKEVEAKGEEAKGEEEPKKSKSKAKKFEAKEENSDEDAEEKPKKPKSKAKKAVEDAKVEEAKLEDSEAKVEEPKKAKKPKAKKSEEETTESDEAKVEEPKKPKAKAKKAEVEEAKVEEKPKKAKPIMGALNEALAKFTKENEATHQREVASRFSTELGTEDFEQETTYVNGVQYKLNGKCLVTEDGEIVGRLLEDGTAQMHAQPPPDEDDDDDDAWSNAAGGR